MKVTDRLGSLFIEENLQVRERQAVGTTTFITAEAERLRQELEQQEKEVNFYKVQHRFELPDQLDANLRTLEQLRSELQSNVTTMANLQERREKLEKQIIEAETTVAGAGTVAGAERKESLPAWQQVELRKKQLNALLLRYSEKHPDVIRFRSEIEQLEKEAEVEKARIKETPTSTATTENPLRKMLVEQLEKLKSSIFSLQQANQELKKQIVTYQQRLESTPLRAIELSKITRTYDITLRKYQDLLAKGLESQLSENLEKKQKGEQFQVVDPANFPLKPVRPNRPFILLVGLVGGLLGGFGLAFVWEGLDRSFKSSDDLCAYVNVPLLATIPRIITRGVVLERRRAQGLLALSSVGVLLFGLVFIRFFGARFF